MRVIWILFPLVVFSGCSRLIDASNPRNLESLLKNDICYKDLKQLPAPKEKIVVAVYQFRDDTGQYRSGQGSFSYSTALPQNATPIVLKALEDSKWFISVERKNLSNLLGERSIIRSTTLEYKAKLSAEISHREKEIRENPEKIPEETSRLQSEISNKKKLLEEIKEGFESPEVSSTAEKEISVLEKSLENYSKGVSQRQAFLNQMKAELNGLTNLPPMLYAGILLEGGIIAYDTDLLTGGAGVKYLGVGGFGKVRRDMVTVYLRIVSVKNGQILKTVRVSKSVISKEVDVGVYKYLDYKEILEMEAGFSTNDPPSVCLTEAIEEAVTSLIIEGIINGMWKVANDEEVESNPVIKEYIQKKEKQR